MEALMPLLSYFGFGRDNISEGRRRFVVLMAFLSFVLLIAATVAPDWVAGGIEIPVDGAAVSNTVHFRVDLRNVLIERNQAGDVYSPSGYNSVQTYARTDYIARQIAFATYPGCTRGQQDPAPSPPPAPNPTPTPNFNTPINWWCNLPIQNFNKDMDSTFGLMIFSCILVTTAFVLTWPLVLGSTIFANPVTFKVLAGLFISSSFFSIIALITFGASNIKSTFCSVFDPVETPTPGVAVSYCGYQEGFDIAIAGVVWTGLTALLVWFWLPWEAPAVDAKASMPAGFSAIASGGDAAGSSGDYVKAASYNDSGAASGGGYQ